MRKVYIILFILCLPVYIYGQVYTGSGGIGDLTGEDSSVMIGSPSGAQPIHDNLTQLSNGIDNKFTSAKMVDVAPTDPAPWVSIVAMGINWNPYNLATATITGTGNISFVDGGAGVPDTITDSGNGFVTAGFQAGMLIQVSDVTSNIGYYQAITVDAGTITVSNVVTGISDGALVTESGTNATIDGGFPQEVLFDGSNWIVLGDNMGNRYSQYYLISSKSGDITVDGRFVGFAESRTAGESLVPGNAVYLANDGKCYKADNDSTTAIANKAIGFAINTAADTETLIVAYRGTMRLDSWNWTVNEGSPIYLSATAGAGTETRPTSAVSTVQQIATIIDADTLSIGIQPLDFSITRTGTDEDGRTLTCLEATNTWWDGDGTFVGPLASTCPTQDFTLSASSAADLTYDPNAADDTIVDGVANADGENWSSPNAIADMIKCSIHDTDTVRCMTNGGWTAE